jgi:hypothetical protein
VRDRDHFKLLKAALVEQAGFQPIVAGDFEALKVEFAPETLKLGKSTPDRFKRMLAEEIKTLKPGAGIRLTFRGKSANGAPILYVLRLLSTNPRIRK